VVVVVVAVKSSREEEEEEEEQKRVQTNKNIRRKRNARARSRKRKRERERPERERPERRVITNTHKTCILHHLHEKRRPANYMMIKTSSYTPRARPPSLCTPFILGFQHHILSRGTDAFPQHHRRRHKKKRARALRRTQTHAHRHFTRCAHTRTHARA